jgi:hypothetical protein
VKENARWWGRVSGEKVRDVSRAAGK